MFSLNRDPLFTTAQLEQIEETAIRILGEVGVRVLDPEIRAEATRQGIAFRGDRAVLDRASVRTFLDDERAKNAGSVLGVGVSGRRGSDDDPPITLGVSQYSQYYLDLETGETRPFTAESLAEQAKLVDALAGDGVRAGAPGTPMDVPPTLQSIAIYWTSATYCRHGGEPLDPRSVAAHRYVMDMATAIGRPVTLLPIYLVSPLTLAGDALAAALAFRDRIRTVWVLSMPAMGATAPIRPAEAYATCAAEVIGSAMIVRALVELEVGWEIQMFPFDLRHLSVVFGSPENLLLQFGSAEVNAFLHGTGWTPWANNIHTMGHEPGIQAAAEKASIMTAGALLGARHFVCGGTLSLDEVFSPEQLVIDCEMRAHVARLVAGLDGEIDADRCVAAVREGIARGFMGLDDTLDRYREVYWHPRMFERRLIGPWREAGSPDVRKLARDRVRALRETHEFALPSDIQREIDRIYACARRDLAG